MEKIRQYLQKININQEYFSLRFFVAGMILSISFSLLFISLSKAYTSSMIIFVNAKSGVAVQQKEQIINNISQFPKTLALYDRLLKYNKDVTDMAEGKSPVERKKYWNSLVSTMKIGRNSSLIKISITTKQANDAEQLVKKTTETLFYFSSVYYNIKDDLDLRVVENPITKSVIVGWNWIILLSLILGFSISFIFQSILVKRKDYLIDEYKVSKENIFSSFEKESVKRSDEEEKKSLENLYLADIPTEISVKPKKTFSDAITSGFQEIKRITKNFEKNKYPNFSEVPKQKQTVASAPDNLPVADAPFINQSNLDTKQQEQSENIEIKDNPKIKIHPEPDTEKLKKRLNELLRGGL